MREERLSYRRLLRDLAISYSLATLIYMIAFAAAALTRSAARIITATVAAAAVLSSWAMTSDAPGLGPLSMAGRTITPGPVLLGGVCLVVLASYAWLRAAPTLASALPRLMLAWLVMIAVDLRLHQLRVDLGAPLWPDVWSALEIMSAMTHPYDTGVREPLWLWVLWLSRKLFGPGELMVRLVSLAISVLVVPAAYLLGRDYGRSRVLGLVAASFITIHSGLVGSSVQAHRTELLIIAITAVTYFALLEEIRPIRRLVGLSAATASLVLTSLAMVVVAAPLALWAWYTRRIATRDLLIVALITGVLLAPHIAYNYVKFGTYSLFSTRYVPVFYRNYEFMVRKGTGCPGCPSIEEYQRNSYSGDPISMGEYLFGLHTPGEVAARMAEGFAMTYLQRGRELEAVVGGSSWVQYALFLGGGAIVLASRRRELLLVFILTLNLTAFVVPLTIDVRLLVGPAVIAAYVQAVPITLVLERLAKLWGARRALTP